MEEYIELDRRFRDLTDKEREDTVLLSMWGFQEAGGGDSWEQLLKSERVVVLAEAGSGKTWEMRNQAARLTKSGRPAFFIPIEALEKSDVRGFLSMEPGEVERFDGWLAMEDQPAWIFLDAVDELKLIHGKIEHALGKLVQALGPARDRARVLLSCRPTDWRPVKDMEIFQTKFPPSDPKIERVEQEGGDDAFLAPVREKKQARTAATEPEIKKLRCVILLPLGKEQIERFAVANGVGDPKALLAEINRREAWAFARRPLDLKGLIANWRANGSLGTLRQQHETDIANSLRDDPDRRDQDVLSPEKARDGAERIALALLLTKRRAIKAPEQTAGDIDASTLDASDILTDWTEAQVKSLLRRSIFDPATYGRVRFHHRSIQEFLAAARLAKLCASGMTKRKLRALLVADTYGERIVIPSMRPVAAWMSYDHADICREVLAREPEVLILHGDPETLPLNVRQNLIRSYVDAYKGGDWRGLQMPVAEVQRLANPELASEIKAAWREPKENEEVSEFLLKLIWLGSIQDCADIAAEALLDASLGPYARLLAAKALSDCKRVDLLRAAADDMLSKPERWPDRIAYSISHDLFPEVITAHELETLIRRTPEPTNSVSGFSWNIYTLIDKIEPGSDAAISLRNLLARLIREGCDPNSDWYNLSSQFEHLSGALAKLCCRQMERTSMRNAELIHAGVVACTFHGTRDVVGREDVEQLKRQFAALDQYRDEAFWCELDMLLAVKHGTGRSLLFELLHEGAISSLRKTDWDWLFKELTQPRTAEAQDVAFYALVDIWLELGKPATELSQLNDAVKHDKALSEFLVNLTKPAPPDKAMQKMQRQQAAFKAKREAEQQRIEKSWSDWKKAVDADPAGSFEGKRAQNSMWALLQWLSFGDENRSHLGYANWRAVRATLGDTIADGFEHTVRSYWRETTPRIWSTRKPAERQSIWGSQNAALTGLNVEVSTVENWKKKLASAEARRAAEWALTDLNGAPEWLDVLAKDHEVEVRAALLAELEAEFKEIDTLQHPHTLNLLRYGQERARDLAVPAIKHALRSWPQPPKEPDKEATYIANLDTTLSIVVLADACDAAFADQCEKRYLSRPKGIGAIIWLQGLCACDLKRGVRAFKKALLKLPKKERLKFAIEWFGSVFGMRDRSRVPITLKADAALLLELTQLVFKYVRREDDIDHKGEVYSPGPRDEAESARNRLLTALIELPGEDGYRAVLTLSDEPLFAHMADRIRMLARNRAANDSEADALSPMDFRALESRYETLPKTRDALFQVMLDRLEDMEHDIRHHAFSDREVLAGIDQEVKMQPLLAKKFEDSARGQYQVVREDEAADRKKNDVKLLASSVGLQAVTEIKIGDKWTVSQLESALKSQLLGQYLRHANCTAGCLLVTYARGKTFKNPDTKKPITFEQVIARLRKFATKLEAAERGRVRLSVFGLDLRPPLQASKAGPAKKRKAAGAKAKRKSLARAKPRSNSSTRGSLKSPRFVKHGLTKTATRKPGARRNARRTPTRSA